MSESINQSPEQIARDNIDKQLNAAGWAVQDKDKINWNKSIGVAIREYQTDAGPADYVLFVEKTCWNHRGKKRRRGTKTYIP